ncbi:MAG: DUF4491 family protein [Muribaculum sp.]|nr:DUF4491 family protein [Muribaculum sp.]
MNKFLTNYCTLTLSILNDNFFWQTLLAVIAFSCFWSILEVFEQKKRVERGWFPRKNDRK